MSGDRFDPLYYLLTFFGIGADLEGGSFACVDVNVNLTPPAGLDHFQFDHCFEDINSGKISARNGSLGDARFATVTAFERGPDLSRVIKLAGRRKHEDAAC